MVSIDISFDEWACFLEAALVVAARGLPILSRLFLPKLHSLRLLAVKNHIHGFAIFALILCLARKGRRGETGLQGLWLRWHCNLHTRRPRAGAGMPTGIHFNYTRL